MLAALALAWTPAHAANCDAILGRLGATSADDLPALYSELATCSAPIAESSFNRFLEKATDTDSLVGLAQAAIAKETWKPLWGALGKVTSYDARDEIARRVGESCTAEPKVLSFLQGAYFGLRDIEFQQWDDAFSSCQDDKLWAWMDKRIQTPPDKLFDEKYDALMAIYVRHKRADALPALAAGAVKAAQNGPFDAMLMKMGEAVAPDLGNDPDPADHARLEAALVDLAKQLPPEKARSVANQLANSGSDGAAAKLLGTLYPDRVQASGGFMYGAASVEAADCAGKKTAYIHWAQVTEPGQRWAILKAVEEPLRAAKPKSKGCTVDTPWPVLHSPEPLAKASDAESWAQSLERDWASKGFDVKLVKEKPVPL